MDNGFKTKTKLTPIASSKTLAERYGDGKNVIVNVKIPLTENSIGYFDLEDVLGNADLNSEHKGWFHRLYDNIKLSFYNFAFSLGYSEKLKISSVIDFPEIDSRFIKSAKVKKIFFTTEDCRPEEDTCNDRTSVGSNFNLVDTFFANVSGASDLEKDQETQIEQLSDIGFYEAMKNSFAQTPEVIKKNLNKETSSVGLNLVKYLNKHPQIDLDQVQLTNNESVFILNTKNNKRGIADYLKGEKFKHLIRRVKYRNKAIDHRTINHKKNKEIYVYLRDGAQVADVLNIIKSELRGQNQKMFIFRLQGHYIEAKKYFEADRFKGIVKDSTMIGRSLYVELHSIEQVKVFEAMLDLEKKRIDYELDIYKIDRCIRSNCIDLAAPNVNLLPLLLENPHIKIDTYLSVKTLGSRDFKYNGYIDVEIALDIPL